jgi:hypothetical protein
MLIAGLVPKKSYVGLYGKRSSAKSFLALHMVMSAAAGMSFFGQFTERFGSIYCVGEKKNRFGKRVRAWLDDHNVGDRQLAVKVRWGVPDLTDPDSVSAFIEEINATALEFSARGAPLALIVLDTLSRAIGGKNVSDAESAGSATVAIQRIIDETGCTVMPLAHVAKLPGEVGGGAQSMKGAGEWEDAADAVIRIERDALGDKRTMTNTKQSDEKDGAEWAFTLGIVDLGETPRGRPITSCVVRQIELEEANCGTKAASKPLSPNASKVMQAYDEMMDAGQAVSVPLFSGVKPDTKGLQLGRLRERVYHLGLNEETRPPADAEKFEQKRWEDTRKKAWQRAFEEVQKTGRLRQEQDFVWVPQ